MSALSLQHPALASAQRLFTAWLNYRLAYRDQHGVAVAIIADQQLLWTTGFGYANIGLQEPAQSSTIFRVASITKLFTATAIMQLRDQGKLNLHDPIQQYLPWFNMAETFPAEPPITILNLLTHTAGLPREPLSDHWLSNRFPAWPAIKELLPNQQTILPRDSKWKYSNLALALAGEIVAAAAGRPYHNYVHEQILQPLGMTDSYIETIDAGEPRLATGYGRRQSNGQRVLAPHTDSAGLSAAFNLATTAVDLAKFVSFQLRADDDDDNQVLRARTRREMHRPHWVNPDWQGGWGIGFEILRQNGQIYHGHGGAVQGFRTGVYFSLAEKLGAVVLTNADDGDPATIMTKVLSWFGPAILAARKNPDAREELPAAWAAYYGRYRNVWGDQEILAYNGELVAISPDAPDPTAGKVMLEPAGTPHHFRLNQTQTGFGSHGEIVHFELAEDERASRLVGPGAATNGSARIEEW